MPLFMLILLASVSSFASPLEIQEAWSGVSSPLLMGKNYELKFGQLPLKGKVNQPQHFWSGDYWAMVKGNINYRWNSTEDYELAAPSNSSQLQQMSSADKARLSPSEKFDLFNGRYDYPLKAEVKKITSYDAKSWEGICHGWAPASMNHNEPKPKIVTTPDGIKLYFGSADIKAILSFYYAFPYQVADTHQVGRRCDHHRFRNRDADCKQDLNAGAFHIILTNRIALENQGFLADMNRFIQVWNHPILSYSSEVLDSSSGAERNSAPGTVRTVSVSTSVTYADESINSWNTLIGTSDQKFETKTMSYTLDLDANGAIIGGEWTSKNRPDFLWIKEKPTAFTGSYARLAELLND